MPEFLGATGLPDSAVYPPSLDAVAKRRDIGGHACKRGKEGSELRDLSRLRVGSKDDVLVVHLHLSRHEIACWIHKAYRIDDRHRRPVHFRAINSEFFGKFSRFASVKKDRTRIGLQIKQPTGSCHPFRKRHPPGCSCGARLESELSLYARGPEGKEGLRLLIDINGVTRPRPNVVPGLIDKRAERNR